MDLLQLRATDVPRSPPNSMGARSSNYTGAPTATENREEDIAMRTATGTLNNSFLSSFLQQCVDEENTDTSQHWEDASGLAITDVRNLARSSSGIMEIPPPPTPDFVNEDYQHQLSPFADSHEATLLVPMVATEKSVPESRGCLALVLRRSRRVLLAETQAERCPICLEGLRKGQRAQTLPCFHQMHRRCCAKYFKSWGVKPQCPVCRFSLADQADDS